MKKILTALSLTTAIAAPFVQAQVNAETTQPDKVIVGVDQRTRIADTTQNPYQSIVSLVQTYGANEYVCTGTVIAKNKVITAAHCMYDNVKGGFPSKVTLAPGRDVDKLPFGEFDAQYIYVPQEWQTSKDSNHDIAIIEVAPNDKNQEIGEVVTQQKLEKTNDFKNKDISITGYPGDKMKIFGPTQWTHRDIVKGQSGNQFNYNVDTMGGQSGSSVFDNATGNIIGIHTSGGPAGNFATQLNDEIYGWVQDMLKKEKGQDIPTSENPTTEKPIDDYGNPYPDYDEPNQPDDGNSWNF